MITGAQHALAVATTAAGISGGELTWRLSALAGLLIIAAFLAGAEISLVSVNRFRIRSLSDEGNRRAEKLDMLLEQPNRFLSTILMLTLLVQVGASAIATGLANSIGLPVAGAVATGMMTFLIFIFSEMAPKTYATNHTERVALAVTPIVNLLSTIFHPPHRLFLSLEHGLHASSGYVFHPPGQAELPRLVHRVCAVIYSLHPSAYYHAHPRQHHATRVVYRRICRIHMKVPCLPVEPSLR